MKRTIFTVFFSILFITAFSQKKWDVQFYHEIKGQEAILYADNNEFMPVSTVFVFELENMISSLESHETVVIPAKDKRMEIARFTKINPSAANKFTYRTRTNFGDTTQNTFDEDYTYWLPFGKDKTFLVYQGYGGKLSHQNSYALDFNLKVGDEIYAAREGTVTEVITKNTQSCPEISCAKFNNVVMVMHNDGTFAEYTHLKLNGSILKKGDSVEKGQLIGLSGNTGYSTGPHLHFSVFLNRIDGSRDYIKTKFKTSESDATLLEEKKTYTRNY